MWIFRQGKAKIVEKTQFCTWMCLFREAHGRARAIHTKFDTTCPRILRPFFLGTPLRGERSHRGKEASCKHSLIIFTGKSIVKLSSFISRGKLC